MDNLTHTLTGLMLSRAGLNRYHARAGLILMVSANLPDIDTVSLFGGPLSYLHYHRWYAHSIALAPVLAILPVLLALARSRSWRGWMSAYLLSLTGLASHLLLDWTNAYGIRLLLPFSSEWLHLDATNIVDLWIWAALLLGVLAPLLGRLVSSEIGAKPGSGRGLAIAALVFLVAYDSGRVLLHQRAVETLDSRIYDGHAPARVAAFPAGAGNPLAWVGWVKSDGRSIRYALDLRAEFDPGAGATFYDSPPSPALDAAKRTDVFQQFQQFAIYPLWEVSPVSDPEGGKQVELRDWRFPFAATAIVDSENRVVHTSFHM